MKIVIIHDTIAADARTDELDALTQARVIAEALGQLGHRSSTMPFTANLDSMRKVIQQTKSDLAVNLVESVNGSGRWVHLAPALLDEIRLPYTGSGTEAMFLTANKILAKKLFHAHGIATPRWFEARATKPQSHKATKGETSKSRRAGVKPPPIALSPDHPISQSRVFPGRYIIKSVWEEASVGLDGDSVIEATREGELAEAVATRLPQLGGEGFAEEFIDGREFNLSLLADDDGPQVLPPAEIDFVDYGPDKPKVVGYRAKWDADSFEFHHTPRRFDFPSDDALLLEKLTEIACLCWDILWLRGYARVDFRVDASGRPWVLEVNANPCLSPDAGFFAAAQRAGLTFEEVVGRILSDALHATGFPSPLQFENRQ